MSSYETFLSQCDSSKLKIEFMHVICDETLQQQFIMQCNIYCTGNAYVFTDRLYSTHLRGRKEQRKFVAIAKRAKKGTFKLRRTVNSLGYTRLIYGFE